MVRAMYEVSPTPQTGSKRELYEHLCDQLQMLIRDERDFVANCANTASLLFASLPDVNWAGFYLHKNGELVLGPFQGKPACARIAIGKGVCGTAAAQGESLVVPDTAEFDGHIVCDPASRSEIVVPMISWGEVIGVLDVDSPVQGRFDDEDRDGLEAIASILLDGSAIGSGPDLE